MLIVVKGYIVKLNLPRCLEDPCVYTGNDQHKSVPKWAVILLLLNYS